MIRVLRLASLALAATIAATPSPADTPNPGQSITPDRILLVGRGFLTEQPSPLGAFCVLVRDGTGAPVAGALVEVSFLSCPDISICAGAADPTVTIDCASRTARKIADANGSACFTLEGGAMAGACAPPSCAQFRADGVIIGYADVAAFDLDSAGNISPADGSRWLDDYFGPLCSRIDLDGSGTITAADFSFWQEYYFGSFIQGCAPGTGGRCP